MKTAPMTTEAPAYMHEYAAFTALPFTAEQPDGTITDMNSGETVTLPATHPDFAQQSGQLAAQHCVNVSFNRESN